MLAYLYLYRFASIYWIVRPAPEARPPCCTTHRIDECKSKPCLNNGVCRDEVNGFKCICTYPFSGETCDTRDTTTPSANVNLDKGGNEEESAASKQGKQQGTTIAVAGGVSIFVVDATVVVEVVIVVVSRGIVLGFY